MLQNIKLYLFIIFCVLICGYQSQYHRRPNFGLFPWGNKEFQPDIKFSPSEKCTRKCFRGDRPKICYYKFHLELYPAMGEACRLCTPNITQNLRNDPACECILVDGVERTVYPVNRMIPGPQIQVCLNDYIVVDVDNEAEGIGASIHWHGLFQHGYQYYDGVPFVTQCPISGLGTFRYQFKAAQPGTYFWHSHVSVHRMDGQYGSLIIREPLESDPHSSLYDEDDPTHVILISDWFHELATERYPGLRVRLKGQAPDNFLINGVGKYRNSSGDVTNIDFAKFHVKSGKRYRFRLVNSLASQCISQLRIEDHRLLIIAQDGANNEPVYVDSIMSGAGERVDFVLNANRTSKSYWIQVRGIGECDDSQVQQLATLEYAEQGQEQASNPPTYSEFELGILYNPVQGDCGEKKNRTLCPSDLKTIERFDKRIMREQADVQFVIPFDFFHYDDTNTLPNLFSSNGSKYPTFFVTADLTYLVSVIDDIIYDSPAAPPLSQREGHRKFCTGPDSPTCQKQAGPLPCTCTHFKKIRLGSVVEIVLYDRREHPRIVHPFHLHGTNFHVFDMGNFGDTRNITTDDMKRVIERHGQRLRRNLYDRPSQKDTVIVPRNGWVIFRFIASNPGFWLLHCHLDWHARTGMEMIFQIGDASDLPPIPEGFPTCGSFTPPVNPK